MLPLTLAYVQTAPPVTLTDALTTVRWSVAERGPLLVIGAEKLTLEKKETLPRSLPLNQILPRFQRKLVHVGNMWVVAPESQWAVSDWRTMTAEKLAAEAKDPLLTLFGALDQVHLAKAGREAGLGRADLPPKLQPLFDWVMSLISLEATDDEAEAVDRRLTLSDTQRHGTRIHLAWSYSWQLSTEKDPEDSETAAYAGESLPSKEGSIDREHSEPSTYVRKVPSKPKASDLNFSLLEGSISLEGITDVKALVAQIAKATGLELYADVRLEKLSVLVRGSRAKVSDVLQALCLGVGGTVRRLGNTYLLTEERIPWHAQTIIHWQLMVRAHWLNEHAAELLTQKLEKEASVLRAAIPALPGEPHPNTISIYSETEYKAPAIPQAVQRQVSELLEKNVRERASATEEVPEKLTDTKVTLTPRIQFWMSVPEYGLVSFGGSSREVERLLTSAILGTGTPDEIPAELKKPVRWPERWKVRILRIAPETPDKAQQLAQAARAAGFTEIWLDVPVQRAQAEPLVKAVAKSSLPVTLVVSPLERPPDTHGDGFVSDLLASGETTDTAWKREDKDLKEFLKEMEWSVNSPNRFLVPLEATLTPVCELARIPGIRGLALIELSRPGYTARRYPDPYGGGYIPEWRQAFIQRWHADPADLLYTNDPDDDDGFFFPQFPSSVMENWSQFRTQYAQRWRELLYTRLRLIRPGIPLFTTGSRMFGSYRKGFAPWTNGSTLPKASLQKSYFAEFVADTDISAEKAQVEINQLIQRDKRAGFLCDLSRVSALSYLKELRQPAPAKSGQ